MCLVSLSSSSARERRSCTLKHCQDLYVRYTSCMCATLVVCALHLLYVRYASGPIPGSQPQPPRSATANFFGQIQRCLFLEFVFQKITALDLRVDDKS